MLVENKTLGQALEALEGFLINNNHVIFITDDDDLSRYYNDARVLKYNLETLISSSRRKVEGGSDI
jgi:hypothetical protein